jgi:hypothetical protein
MLHEKVLHKRSYSDQVNPLMDLHTKNIRIFKMAKSHLLTFETLAVNRTHSNSSPTRRKNSSTCGLFVT